MATVINSGDCIVWAEWATPQRLKQFKENKIILFLTKIFRSFAFNGMRMAETYDNTPFCKSFTVVSFYVIDVGSLLCFSFCPSVSLSFTLTLSHSLSFSHFTNPPFIRCSLKKRNIYVHPFLMFTNYYFSLSCEVTELYFNSQYNFILH